MASSPHLGFYGEVREATNCPVFHAERIVDVAMARHAIASGKLDIVGMTRAYLADPHSVRKITEAREANIRPCVGAIYCIDCIYKGGAAHYFHNAASRRELTMLHVVERAAAPCKIVVVDAGPARLEAARPDWKRRG